MLVSFWFVDVRKIERVSRMQHGVGEDLLLIIVHAVQVNGHQQRANLVVSDRAARDAVDEEIDLTARKLFAVTLLADYILRSQIASPFLVRTTACAETASPWPTASSPSPVLAFTLTHEISTPKTSAIFSRIAGT